MAAAFQQTMQLANAKLPRWLHRQSLHSARYPPAVGAEGFDKHAQSLWDRGCADGRPTPDDGVRVLRAAPKEAIFFRIYSREQSLPPSVTENLKQTESRFADQAEGLFQQHRPKAEVQLLTCSDVSQRAKSTRPVEEAARGGS